MRIGHGYDVHRLVEGRKLILCGVEIPYEKGLLGHSDADVLLHAISDALLRQDDVRLIEVKDYIKNPKSNGYRSLHLIIEIPIFLHDEKRYMKVEVQFRTISMDWWASLEHKIKYKKDVAHHNLIEKELLECAEIASDLDERMEQIYKYVSTEKE